MWKKKKGSKGGLYLGGYEFSRSGKRKFVLKNSKTGREASYDSHEAAKKDGWVRV
jgi:hypothetical protein